MGKVVLFQEIIGFCMIFCTNACAQTKIIIFSLLIYVISICKKIILKTDKCC